MTGGRLGGMGRQGGRTRGGSFTAIVIAVLSPWIPRVICADEFQKPMKLELMVSRCRLLSTVEYIKLYCAYNSGHIEVIPAVLTYPSRRQLTFIGEFLLVLPHRCHMSLSSKF